MSIRICLCDDCPADLAKLYDCTTQWSESAVLPVYIETFPSAEAFLFRYSEDRRVDILLLDIEMSAQNGIQLARQLRSDGFTGEIVFVTSHGEFWDAGYEVDALHYLTKPVNPEKLHIVLTKAAEKVRREPPSMVITCEGETFRLYLRDILYIEASLHYVTITTTTGVYRLKESISTFEKRLGDGFYRIHRGVLVSLSHITRISRKSVWLGDTELPLARGNYDSIHRAFIDTVEPMPDQSGSQTCRIPKKSTEKGE